MRPIRFNTWNFCCIYLLNTKNLECRFTWIRRCCTQGLHISFQFFFAKVLIWKLFMLLVESPFVGWFLPFKRLIEKVLIWIVFNLLVFLFAGCLFLEVPSFSGQFERKAQNLEWGPSDSTHATFAVFTCWTTRTWNAATPPSKGAICRVCIFLFKFSSQEYWFGSFSYLFILLVESPFACGFFPFKRLIEKVLIWSVFKLLVFLLLAAFSLKFLVLAVNMSGKSKA